MQRLEETELRKARTVGVNCYIFCNISSGTAWLLQGMLGLQARGRTGDGGGREMRDSTPSPYSLMDSAKWPWNEVTWYMSTCFPIFWMKCIWRLRRRCSYFIKATIAPTGYPKLTNCTEKKKVTSEWPPLGRICPHSSLFSLSAQFKFPARVR